MTNSNPLIELLITAENEGSSIPVSRLSRRIATTELVLVLYSAIGRKITKLAVLKQEIGNIMHPAFKYTSLPKLGNKGKEIQNTMRYK